MYMCCHCGKEFITENNLSMHTNTFHIRSENTGNEAAINKIYECECCNYKTTTNHNLSRHINAKHTKNKIYECGHCNYKTTTNNNLSRHINAKYSNESNKRRKITH